MLVFDFLRFLEKLNSKILKKKKKYSIYHTNVRIF